MNKQPKKYNIKKYINNDFKGIILNELCISSSTFYRKANAIIGDSKGFEACQLYLISAIVNQPINNLISPEAWTIIYDNKKC